MKLKSYSVVNPFDCILWPGLCSGNMYFYVLMAYNCSDCRRCCCSYFLTFVFFQFFLNAFQSLLLQSRFWSFIQVTYHFLMVSLCWMLNQNNCDWKKNRWQWIPCFKLDTHTSVRPRGRPGTPIFYILYVWSQDFLFCFIYFLIAFQFFSIKIWKFLSIRSKIIYIGKKLWEWISSSNLFLA